MLSCSLLICPFTFSCRRWIGSMVADLRVSFCGAKTRMTEASRKGRVTWPTYFTPFLALPVCLSSGTSTAGGSIGGNMYIRRLAQLVFSRAMQFIRTRYQSGRACKLRWSIARDTHTVLIFREVWYCFCAWFWQLQASHSSSSE